jgi:hypothetical protein
MAGEWFTEIHFASGGKVTHTVHPDFAATLAAVKAFRKGGSKDTLRVHSPSQSTHKERQELIDNGAVPM